MTSFSAKFILRKGVITDMIYLDDLDPSELTDEQKEEFRRMFEEDPYHFYNLWRDPDAAQRYFEGGDFQTTPAREVYLKLGALKIAGAPQGVIDYWADILKNRGRPTEDTSALPPKTKPVQEYLDQIDTLCRHINESLNCVIDNVTPDPDDFPDEVPIAHKWQQIMNKAMGAPDIDEQHNGTARHYKATDALSAHVGVEILEVNILTTDAEIDLSDVFDDFFDERDVILPNTVRVKRSDQCVTLYFEYYGCYE